MDELMTPQEWCDNLGATVLDADGWRQNDGRQWDDPITREEFDRRLLRCTIDMTRYPEWRVIPRLEQVVDSCGPGCCSEPEPVPGTPTAESFDEPGLTTWVADEATEPEPISCADFHECSPSKMDCEQWEREPEPLADWERELLGGRCDGCLIRECVIEGNTLTPCTCPPKVDVVDLIKRHTETENGMPVSILVVRDLQRKFGHIVSSDLAVAMLRTRLSHSYPEPTPALTPPAKPGRNPFLF